MADLTLTVERRISGKGVVKLPKQDDAAKIRYLILYADVIRDPRNKYINYNYNPPRGRYATLTFIRNGYVIGETTMDYDRQSWDGVQDIAGQTLIAVKCAYDGILDTFVNLSIALAQTPGGVGLQPLNVTDLITDYESLYLSWDEIRVKCYADTAILFRLYTKQYDTCNPDKDRQDRPPPPPPPPEKTPPGQPIEVSPPYDSNTSDDSNTDPFEGDEPPVTQGSWFITWTYTQTPGQSTCSYLGTPDTFTKSGSSTDVFDVIEDKIPQGEIFRLRQNGVPDPVTFVERGCTPNFDPPPVFTPGS